MRVATYAELSATVKPKWTSVMVRMLWVCENDGYIKIEKETSPTTATSPTLSSYATTHKAAQPKFVFVTAAGLDTSNW